MQPANVMNQKWDYLILLDACRYDFLKRLRHKYFQGTLDKRKSASCVTMERTDKSFGLAPVTVF